MFDGGGQFTPKNGWIRFLCRGRCESWHVPFCKCFGILFNIHNNQPHVIDDALHYEIRKQSNMSGGISGRDIMRIIWVFWMRGRKLRNCHYCLLMYMGA